MEDILFDFLDAIGQNNDAFRVFFMMMIMGMVSGILAVGRAPLIIHLMTLSGMFIFFVAVAFIPAWFVLVFVILMVLYGFIALKGLVNMNGG